MEISPYLEVDEMESLRQELRRLGDNAYCRSLELARKAQCLGAEVKMKRGEFGRAELEAHKESELWMGKHRAFYEALRLLPK